MEDSNPVVYLQLDTDLYTNNYHPFKIRMLEKTLRFSPFFSLSRRISDRIERGEACHATLFLDKEREERGKGVLEKIHCRCGRLEKVVCAIWRGGKGSRVIKGGSCVAGNRGQWNSSPSARVDRSLAA